MEELKTLTLCLQETLIEKSNLVDKVQKFEIRVKAIDNLPVIRFVEAELSCSISELTVRWLYPMITERRKENM
jgi:hypothetical protein